MYKVFVNDKPIILSNQITSDLEYEFCLLNELRIEEVLHKLRHTKVKGFYIYNANLEELWEAFQSFFEVVEAAGGLVFRANEYLLIYRNKRWDLPKGKMENGESIPETALREVEEECGISGLTIEKPLVTTYHVFYEKRIDKLKITHWFLMETTDDKKPIPQEIEGISIAKFIGRKNIPEMYDAMYMNISELLIKYFKTVRK